MTTVRDGSQVTLRLDIVSAEKSIFSGEAEMVFAMGAMGEIGIAPGHAPLLTSLKPSNIRAQLPHNGEEIFYVSGGMLEVQPFIVTVLADTVVRAKDLDEARVLEMKEQTELKLKDKNADVDIARATIELAEAVAQIRAIQALKKRVK